VREGEGREGKEPGPPKHFGLEPPVHTDLARDAALARYLHIKHARRALL